MKVRRKYWRGILVAVFLISLQLLAGVMLLGLVNASTGWSRTYGSDKYWESAVSVVQAADGGYLLAGSSGHSGPMLVKTDGLGNYEWDRTYGEIIGVGSLVSTSDGGYAFLGDGYHTLVKIDAYGNQQWTHYSYSILTSGDSLVQTNDGGFAIAGGDYYDWLVLVKTRADGTAEWTRNYDTFGTSACSIVQTSDGGYAVGGRTISYDVEKQDQHADFYLLKLDALGDFQWNRTYGEGNGDEIPDGGIVQTSDGGYAMGGVRVTPSQIAAWLVKTDSYGNLMWAYEYGKYEAGLYQIQSLAKAADGGYVLAGFYWVDPREMGLILKTDSDGNLQWSRTYEERFVSAFYSVIETSDGELVATGETYAEDQCGDFWLVKVDAMGYIPEFPSISILLFSIIVIWSAITVYTKYPKKRERARIKKRQD